MAFDQYLQGLSPFDPKGSLSDADADRIWNSYKLAGGGRDVSHTLPGAGGRSMFGSMAGMMGNGGILGGIQRMMAPTPGAAPAVPADGAMQPTIGPGAAAPAPAAPPAQFKPGLPQGGILGLLQGQSPQGLIGLLKGLGGGGAPLAGGMPAAGMIGPGHPNYVNPLDPSAVDPASVALGQPGGVPMPRPRPAPQLPLDINPMNQF